MSQQETGGMRAVITDETAPGRLRIGDLPRPTPGGHDCVVRVGAVSLNRGEVKTALAAPSGWRPGWDWAGVVEEAAADGAGPPIGARVVGLAPFGGWSEFVAAPISTLAVIPDGVELEAAATLPVAALTARAALAKAAQKPGRRVLVTGASGGVGVFAIQLAALAGDKVTAVIRNPAHEALVRQLGASEVVIGDISANASGPFDLAVESVGGETLGAVLGKLGPGGTCVLLGASAGAVTTFDASKFRAGGTSLYGLVMQWEFQFEPPAAGLAELLGHLRDGRLSPVIERRAPMSEIATVARDLLDRRFVGKAVLTW